MNFSMRKSAWVLIQAYFRLFAFCVVLLFLFTVVDSFASSGRKMKVKQPLEGRLVSVLVETEELHRALVDDNSKNENKKDKKLRMPAAVGVNDQIKVLINSLTKVSQYSKLAGPSQVALEKIVGAARARLTDAQSVSKNHKRKLEFLSESFRQIIQIAQMYDLNHQYKLFFCSKDRAMWLQSGGKAQNPFDSTGGLRNCGIVMR